MRLPVSGAQLASGRAGIPAPPSVPPITRHIDGCAALYREGSRVWEDMG